MQVILVRHAVALDKDIAKKNKMADPKRPLTSEGQKKFAKQVKKNLEKFKDVDLYLTSPYIRAKETLDIILKQTRNIKAKKNIFKAITPDANPEVLFKWLDTRKEEKIVVVSHEPYLSHFLNLVLPSEKPRKIRKGDIIQLERSWKKLT